MKDVLHLLQNANDPDVKAFSLLFHTRFEAICLFAYRIVRDEQYAEDLTIEAFEKAWNKWKEFKAESDVLAFLYVDVRNKSFNFLKKLSTKNTSLGIEEDITEHADDTATTRSDLWNSHTEVQIWKAIKAFPEQRRKVFYLYYGDDKTIKEIAAELNLDASTVRSHKQKGLDSLRSQFGGRTNLDIELLLIISALLVQERTFTLF